MKHTLLSIAGAGALMLAIASCGNEELVTLQQAGETTATDATLTEIIATIGGSSDTRTTATADDHGVKFTWAANDQLGIYTAEGRSAAYTYATESKFTNPDGLKGSAPFAAFYPYNAEGTAKAMPVKYTGQTQKGDNNLDHIGQYTYLAATNASTNANGALELKLAHLGCLVQLKLTLPQIGKISSVTLSADEAVFATEGTFNLETSTFTATKTESSMTLALSDVKPRGGNPITLYMMLPPTMLDGKTVKATTTYTNGETVDIELTGKNFVKGKAYKLEGTSVVETRTGSLCYNSDWNIDDTTNEMTDFTADDVKARSLVKYNNGYYAVVNAYEGIDVLIRPSGITSGYVYNAEGTAYYIYGGDYSYVSIEDEYVTVYWLFYNYGTSASTYEYFTISKNEYVGMLYNTVQASETSDWDFTTAAQKSVTTLIDNGDGTYKLNNPCPNVSYITFTPYTGSDGNSHFNISPDGAYYHYDYSAQENYYYRMNCYYYYEGEDAKYIYIYDMGYSSASISDNDIWVSWYRSDTGSSLTSGYDVFELSE